MKSKVSNDKSNDKVGRRSCDCYSNDSFIFLCFVGQEILVAEMCRMYAF